jgi:hypothetical protein
MPKRALTPNVVNSLSPVILVDASYVLNILDVNVFTIDVQTNNVTVTLPQNPQVGVTLIQFMSEGPFLLSGGAANPLSPADPLPVGPNANFSAGFTAQGWQIQGQLTNLVAHNAGLYGTGADGSVIFDGASAVTGASRVGSVYTLTRDSNYNNATVNSGVTVVTNGWRLQCAGLLLNNGNINNNGASAAVGVAGGGGGGNSLSGGAIGGNGAVNGVGQAGSNQPATARNPNAGAGGAGGAGGGNAGGAGGTLQAAASTVSTFQEAFAMQHNVLLQGGATTTFLLTAGTGGGGGGSGAAGQGGGGGGGGGVCGIFAFFFINSVGSGVQANGGVGASGTTGVSSGGGGGGGGGAVMILTRTLGAGGFLTGGGTVQAVGGASGAGVNGGSAGTVGAAGSVTVLAA